MVGGGRQRTAGVSRESRASTYFPLGEEKRGDHQDEREIHHSSATGECGEEGKEKEGKGWKKSGRKGKGIW